MASASGRKTSSSGKKKTASARKRSGAQKKNASAYQAERDYELFREISLIVLFVVMVLLFLCNFGLIGLVGNTISGVMFGLFGWLAYIVPVILFVAAAFWFANEGSPTAVRKMAAGVVLFLMAGVFCEILSRNAAEMTSYDIKLLYEGSRDNHNGGGVVSGSLTYLLLQYLGTVGTVLVALLCAVVSLILLTEKLFLNIMREKGSELRERSRETSQQRREVARLKREELVERRRVQEEARYQEEEHRRERREDPRQEREYRRESKEENRRRRREEKEDEKILRINKKAVGVTIDTSLEKRGSAKGRDDIHEITLDALEGSVEDRSEEAAETAVAETNLDGTQEFDFDRIHIRNARQVPADEPEVPEDTLEYPYAEEVPEEGREIPGTALSGIPGRRETGAQQNNVIQMRPRSADIYEFRGEKQAEEEPEEENEDDSWEGLKKEREKGDPLLTREAEAIQVHSEAVAAKRPVARLADAGEEDPVNAQVQRDIRKTEKAVPKKYIFPPLSRLQKGTASNVDTSRELKETAMHLQQTLATFGVKVTITDISQGPTVTRYEMQPEQGVKVSKIVSLSDDIKLNLAATDIRIEAPIPGKAAVGIEVPNKENMMVALRDLLESREFREFPSNIAFAVGKDIAGQVVVADIAKMPHMLIAGSTGSGKSVCINTLIMSILYKAHPDDVKLILVDPKVVELSVYNGIPHLLIPVVTDPKKASAALHWGVSEMSDRYKKFADFNVRDLKGYNKKVEAMREEGKEDAPAKLPQIVIIVDELADLMMVAPGEVEESICRLAQLARAAGIHLIIATQRPSVDVITGLIKANMPSRIAFAVSSGVDSRTILDMVGAEKLLGKGDMLFYPQGYSKPARIQGAFVSDREVSDVVDFLKNQAIGNVYAEDIEAQIRNIGSSGSSGSSSSGGSDSDGRDEYFAEAGRFIIEKDKASIGMLQRVLKIGFNRAARIMDQLAEYGVVGEEEGTKPRKVLMSPEQFEQLLEEMG